MSVQDNRLTTGASVAPVLPVPAPDDDAERGQRIRRRAERCVERINGLVDATGKRVPMKGLPQLVYVALFFLAFAAQFVGFTRARPVVPPLSLRERRQLAIDRLWELCCTMDNRQRIISINSCKGGSGKTTTAAWLSVVIAWAIKEHVIAIDANEVGHLFKRLGISGATIEILDMIRNREKLATYEKISKVAASHREAKVTVVTSNPATNRRTQRSTYEKALDIVATTGHSVICDCGTGVHHPYNLGSLNRADVLVFPGRINSGDSLDDILNTLRLYSDLGYEDKVGKGIVVVVGAKPRRRKEFAERYGVPVKQVLTIPRNRYLEGDKPVTLNQMRLVRRKVIVAFLELAVAIYEAELSDVVVDVDAKLKAINGELPPMDGLATHLTDTTVPDAD